MRGSKLAGLLVAWSVVPIAMILVPVREFLGAPNVALMLLIAVVCAALIGGRPAGVLAAVAATASFNFFHVEPYLTLRVHDDRDVLSMLVLFAAALLFGEISTRLRAREEESRQVANQLTGLSHLVGQLAGGMAADDFAMSATWVTRGVQRLADCTTTDDPDGHDVQIPVAFHGRHLGYLVADRDDDGPLDERSKAFLTTIASLIAVSTQVPSDPT